MHQQIGLVLQDAMLFRASVGDNIAYGRPDATMDEIENAAHVAQAHDFVTSCPRATTPYWPNAGPPCPADNGNGSPWRARS